MSDFLARLEELDKALPHSPQCHHDMTQAEYDLLLHIEPKLPEIIALVKAARKYRDHLNSPYPHTRLLAALEALDK